MNEAVSITVVRKDGTIYTGQSTNGIDRKDMDKCFYTLEDGKKVNTLLREKAGTKKKTVSLTDSIEGHAV